MMKVFFTGKHCCLKNETDELNNYAISRKVDVIFEKDFNIKM